LCVLLTGATALAADTVTIGTVATTTGTGTVVVPIYVRDASGTPLGRDQAAGHRISGLFVDVVYGPQACVTGSVVLSDPANGLFGSFKGAATCGSIFEYQPRVTGTNQAYSFAAPEQGGSDPCGVLPFALDAPAPGDRVAELRFTLDQCPADLTIPLHVLTSGPTLAALMSDAGVLETVENGDLTVLDGSIQIVAHPVVIAPDAATIFVGGPAQVMTLTAWATQAGDTVVTLTSSAPGIASVPATATIAAGAVSTTFDVTPVSPGGPVTITATLPAGLGGGQATATITVKSPIPVGERSALVDLYNSTNGPGWINSTGWLGPVGTECTWFGVTCNPGATHVTDLSLATNNLVGTIPASLASLASLQNLRLSTNQLTGVIPPELGGLANLRYWYLDSNQLTGTIPPGLGNLASLQDLSLSANQLTGTIPPELGNLANLQSLRLDSNQLAGTIPPELGSLTNLQYLLLSSNQLGGPVPPQLGILTNLQYLALSFNLLTGPIPPALGGLTSLRSLSLSSNQLTGSIPPELGGLTDLRDVNLSSNQMTGEIPAEIQNLTSLVNDHSDLRWNALHSTNAALVAFLNSKQQGGDWQSTQTIAPAGLATGSLTTTSVAVSWTPIAYTGDTGGYQVLYSQIPGGPYTPFGTLTPDKTASSLTVTGLQPGTPYVFVVRTRTNSHVHNSNLVVSELSAEVPATTAVLPTLTVSRIGTGGGTVTSTPDGINCGTACVAAFPESTVVILDQSAAADSTFIGWAGACTGTGACSVTLDAAKAVTATFDLTPAPAITSADHATFTVGASGSFTVTATGYPVPGLAATGLLPGGLTFVDNGEGTATLGGTPGAGTGGTYPLTFTAHNGAGADAVQAFTLTVNQPAVITSADAATFTVGTPGSFTVTATGYPIPELASTGALPGGVTFVAHGNGTATLAGTPEAGTGGDYTLTITAHNDTGVDATQAFTLTVESFGTGDVNGDGQVDVQDVFYLINFLFAGGPDPIGPADVDGDTQVNVQDVFYLINYLFAGGPAPV